jgi:hypothetical protein
MTSPALRTYFSTTCAGGTGRFASPSGISIGCMMVFPLASITSAPSGPFSFEAGSSSVLNFSRLRFISGRLNAWSENDFLTTSPSSIAHATDTHIERGDSLWAAPGARLKVRHPDLH